MSDNPLPPDARERLSVDPGQPKPSLASALRGNLPVLLPVGFIVFSVLGYLVLSSGGGDDSLPQSRAPQAPMLPATQRGNELSPEFQRQIQEADAARAADAIRQGGSAFPTPIFQPMPPQPREEPPPPAPEPPAPPPLPIRPAELPPPLPIEPPPLPPQQQVRPPPSPQDMNNLLQAMQRQAEGAMGNRLQAAATQFFDLTAGRGGEGAGEASPRIPATTIRSEGNSGEAAGNAVVPLPGTILYARMVGRANSDTPGPVIAEILQGELRGARVLGQFQAGRDGLLIQFRSMTVPARDGRPGAVYPIEAVAVDTENLGASLATSVNRRELEQIALAFGTAFMRGLGQAIGQSGSIISQGLTGTVIQNPVLDTRRQLLVGAGAAAGAAGDVIRDIYGNRPPTIIVEAGTPFGLLFLGGR